MCFAVVRFDPAAEWPVLLAFVRDEDRTRPWSPPQMWWPEQPSVLGGRDDLGGGTWLAVETDPHRPRVACLLNRREPSARPVELAQRRTRGELPLLGVRDGGLDLEVGELASWEPFSLFEASTARGRWQHWGIEGLVERALEPGWHVMSSHGLDSPNRDRRERHWLPRFSAAAAPNLDAASSTRSAWGDWIGLLDGRSARIDDPDSIVIAGLSAAPGFGTVGASLVALAADGRTRLDVNATTRLDPDQWSVAHSGAAGTAR